MKTGERYDVDSLRNELAILREVTYLNTGTVGIMAEPVLERHIAALAAYERGGHHAEKQAREGYERARETLADLINATPDEIALTRNATDGINVLAAGLKLSPNDTVLTTDQEHPAVILPWAAAERRGGAQLTLFTIHNDPEATLASFEQALKPSTRVVVVSHVSCETGVRLPIIEICRRCRELGILTLVDGAQSVGQFPVDVHELGCDFMTGNGHKWLCGPKGTGFLYVRQEALHRVGPVHVGAGSTAPAFDRVALGHRPGSADWGFEPTARRFEFGTRNWHSFAALTDAIDYLAQLDWSAIEDHCAAISAEVKQRLEATPGVVLHSPVAWADSSGLVTFSVDGWDGVTLSRRLWDDFSIIQRRVQVPSAVRVSCAYFTTQEDIDRLMDALQTVISSESPG